jgi:hypothetical protein
MGAHPDIDCASARRKPKPLGAGALAFQMVDTIARRPCTRDWSCTANWATMRIATILRPGDRDVRRHRTALELFRQVLSQPRNRRSTDRRNVGDRVNAGWVARSGAGV